MTLQLTGIHHLTAITATAAANKRFYTETLGLRLVKKTVNQDDTSAYHLFYADGRASPGTDVTFFDWPAARERRGTNAITRTGIRVGGADKPRLVAGSFARAGLAHGDVAEIDGRASLDFEDPEGQRFRLVDDGGAGDAHPWDRSPVPVDHQIRGLGPITISVRDLTPTRELLTTVVNMREERTYAITGRPGRGARVRDGRRRAGGGVARRSAAGISRAPGRAPAACIMWRFARRISTGFTPGPRGSAEFGVQSSGEVERYYFRSLYFREPGGNLFEIATDGPGFAVDEPLDTLGERLSLPPFLEGKRAAIEAGLKPLE